MSAIRNGARVVVWPESTIPLSYATTDFYRNAIESTSATSGADILLGSVAEDPQRPNRLWNAAFLVSRGRTIGHYDKIRLVPFGEYVPLRKMLFFAKKLVRAVGEFEFGANDRPLRGTFAYGPDALVDFLRSSASYRFFAVDEAAGRLHEIQGFARDDIGEPGRGGDPRVTGAG